MESKGLDSVYLSSAIIPQIQTSFSLKHGHRQHIGHLSFTAFPQEKINPIFLEEFYIENREHRQLFFFLKEARTADTNKARGLSLN